MNILRKKENSLAILNGIPLLATKRFLNSLQSILERFLNLSSMLLVYFFLPTLPFTHFCLDFNSVYVFWVFAHSFFSHFNQFSPICIFISDVISVLFTKKSCPWVSF